MTVVIGFNSESEIRGFCGGYPDRQPLLVNLALRPRQLAAEIDVHQPNMLCSDTERTMMTVTGARVGSESWEGDS